MSFDNALADRGAAFPRRLFRALKGPIALAFSCQAEDAAALHLLLHCGERVDGLEVFTLDTNRLFPETEAYRQEIEAFFGIAIRRYHPDAEEERELEAELGEWGMRESPEKRRRCCGVRKVRPLEKALAGKNAWVTGLRAAQSITRSDLQPLEWDHTYGMVKINPLAAWSDEDLSAYVEKHRIPLNPLYAQGFRSIGCAPCTRAVQAGEDIRAGRWWWENPEHKECGLHLKRR
jgi:phosphoadenosine phosphosulfate reductase